MHKKSFVVICLCLLLQCCVSCSGGDDSTDGDGDGDREAADGATDADFDSDAPFEDGDDSENEDGDIDDESDSPGEDDAAEGDDDPESQELQVCLSARDCPQKRACHEGFCGKCGDASECRKLEACLPDGSCGACDDVSQCRDAKTCLHGFCMPDGILQAEISMSETDFTEIHEYVYSDKWYDCSMKVDDKAYGVGEKLRVMGNYSKSFPKRSFRITFPEDIENPGYSRKINYKADWGDFTLMRSFISYHLFRTLTRIPTPRTRYVRLNINDAYYGLMLEVERIGGKFLEENGRDRKLSMYEASIPYKFGALVKIQADEPYSDYYEKHTGVDESDFSDLRDFIENVLWADYIDSGTGRPTSTTRTRQAVNIDLYIDYLAVIALLQNADSVTNNFYFSQQKVSGVDRWEIYPWDMDLTFGCLFTREIEKLCVNPGATHWWLNGIAKKGFEIGSGDCWCNMLIHLVLNDTELLERYKARICEYLDSDIWRRLPDLAAALQEYLTEAVAADERDRNENMQAYAAAVNELVSVMAGREEYLRDQLDCK